MHAAQSIAALKAGKHVQVEIPLCDKLEEGRAVAEMQKKTGLVAMVGHTRRFNPSQARQFPRAVRQNPTSNLPVSSVLRA